MLATVRAGEVLSDPVLALWKDGPAERIEIGVLDDDTIEELLVSALGAPVDAATVRALAARSRGNPMFLRELVNGALEELTPPPDTRGVPAPDEPWHQWLLFGLRAVALIYSGRLVEADELLTMAHRELVDHPAAEARAFVADWFALRLLPERGRFVRWAAPCGPARPRSEVQTRCTWPPQPEGTQEIQRPLRWPRSRRQPPGLRGRTWSRDH